jgi:hypothetical protein
MRKYVFVAIAVILAFSLSACGGAIKSTAEVSPGSADTGQDTENAVQTIESVGLEWPKEYMGSLPAPQSKISKIERLNGTETLPEGDTTTKPSSVNVTMNEMTKEEALDYYNRLKNAGLIIYKDEKGDEDILLNGALGSDNQSLFLFSYEAKYHLGNVSVTFLDVVAGGD